MRKIKIFITIIVLYEFVVLTVLQIPHFCIALFNNNFCNTGNFKYFLLCIMLPVLICLFVWWMPDIAHAICPNKCEIKSEPNVKSVFNDMISKQDIEKFITAAIIKEIQKIMKNHPKTMAVFDDVLDVFKTTNAKKTKTKNT